MPELATILLSEVGSRILGEGVFELASPDQRGVSGALFASDAQGVWFQDARLRHESKMVLVKWEFIDAVLCDTPPPESLLRRSIGF
jgi:hypothetical protein